MAWVVAALVGVLGVLALVAGVIAVATAGAARRAFDAALADETDDGLRARGVLLVDRVRSPLLRWVINRRTGAMAGTVLAGVVRDRIATLRRGGFVAVGSGVLVLILASQVPGMMP